MRSRAPFWTYRLIALGSLYSIAFSYGLTSIGHESNMAALSGVLVGNAILQMSLIIGLTMLGMGIGGFISGFVKEDATTEINQFVRTEVLLTLFAGTSAIQAYAASLTDNYVLLIGISYATMSSLVGFEDALLIRIMNRKLAHLGKAIGYTYLLNNAGGALVGLLYPLIFLPLWGMTGTAYAFGLFDGVITLGLIWYFRKEVRHIWIWLSMHLTTILILVCLTLSNNYIPMIIEQHGYTVSVSKTYRDGKGTRQILEDQSGNVWLYINYQLMFSSRDERIYHEMHAQPALALASQQYPDRPISVLIIGGGDGLLVREMLSSDRVGSVTLVDMDETMTGVLAVSEPLLTLNEGALYDERVTVVNAEGFGWLKKGSSLFDLILVDLPDPETPDLARLYTVEFYQAAQGRLQPGGILVTQATSPYMAPEAYWGIARTMEEVFPYVHSYQAALPSLRIWGWQLGTRKPFHPSDVQIDEKNTVWLTQEVWETSHIFGKSATDNRPIDQIQGDVLPSTLRDPRILFYYEQVNWNN
ncbi:MAG: fused MFS/spermidine synthase [Patescibacteria group bacterium]